jgi:hypothetical protein
MATTRPTRSGVMEAWFRAMKPPNEQPTIETHARRRPSSRSTIQSA